MIISCCADVARGMWGPGNTVDTGPVVVEPGHGSAGDPDVQDDDLARVHRHRGQVVGVLLVPG